MHFRTHAKAKSSCGRLNQSPYHDTMIDHDRTWARWWTFDESRHDNTFVMYSTDNGPLNSWPDAGMTPFRSEKNTTGRRVPRPVAGPISREDQAAWSPTRS
jgi:arylsulfatase